MKDKEQNYYYGIDLIKGILVFLVFFGHIIQGNIRENFLRYIIYSFHMPMFIGISGFLLRPKDIDSSFDIIFKKYWRRIILPWIIAVLIFYGVEIITGTSVFTIKNLLVAFYEPFFHLWYVLGILSYICIFVILWKISKKWNRHLAWCFIFIISSGITLCSQFGMLYRVDITNPYLVTLRDLIGYDFRLYNYIFFVVGFFLRDLLDHNKLGDRKIKCCIYGIAIIAIVLTVILFFFNYVIIEKILLYVLNIALLYVVITITMDDKLSRNNLLEFMGKYSLPIYLYHILCKMISCVWFDEGTLVYYFACMILFIGLCLAIYILRNIKLINKYMFGLNTKR